MADVDATLKAMLEELKKLNTDSENSDDPDKRKSSLRKENLGDLEKKLKQLNELEGSLSSSVAKRILDRQKEEVQLTVLEKQKQKLLDAAKRGEQIDEKELVNLQKKIDAHKRIVEYKQDAIKFGKEMGTIFKSYEKHSFFNVDTMASLWSVMHSPIEFMKNFAATGVINYVDAVLGLVFQINKMEAGLVKSIGATDEFTRSMSRVYTDVRAANVSMQDLQKTSESLFKTFTDFTMIDRDIRDGLVKTTSIMVQAGHSADALSKSIQNMTKAFGVSAEQSQDILVNLDQFAREIGVAPAQMTEDFANMGGSLAKLGSDGVKAFKDLARTSKITGLEMQKLLNITDKFDTFEGAAEQAGKLNAALGGNFVNAMDLLTATDPVERFGMIRDSLQSAGLEFDNMSYYQRKFFTESLGLEDVSDLAKIMSGDMSDFSGEVNKTSADYAKMAEAANRAADFQQRFNSIMMRMIPLFEPLLDSIDRFLDSMEGGDGFVGALKKAGGALEFLGGTIEFVQNHWKKMLGAFILWKTLIPMAGFLTKIFLMLKLKAALASGAFATMGAAIGGAGTAAAPAVPILLSIAAVVTSIGLAAAGMGSMFESIDIAKLKALGAFVTGTALYSVSFGLVAASFAAMATTVGAFAIALRMIPIDKLRALQEISTANATMQMATTGGTAKAGSATTAGKVVLNVDTPVTINLDGKKVAEGTYRFYKEFEKEDFKQANA